MDPSDKALIEAALNGDTESFEMIIRTHSRTLFAVAYAVLQDRAEAEDVVQETFVRAWNKRRWMRDPAKFPAWLTTVARNRACDIIRKRRTLATMAGGPELADTLASPSDPSTSGDEMHAQVQTALGSLPEQHRTALTLRYLEGMDYLTIERTMGLSNGALRGILGRALATMRKTLKPGIEAFE